MIVFQSVCHLSYSQFPLYSSYSYIHCIHYALWWISVCVRHMPLHPIIRIHHSLYCLYTSHSSYQLYSLLYFCSPCTDCTVPWAQHTPFSTPNRSISSIAFLLSSLHSPHSALSEPPADLNHHLLCVMFCYIHPSYPSIIFIHYIHHYYLLTSFAHLSLYCPHYALPKARQLHWWFSMVVLFIIVYYKYHIHYIQHIHNIYYDHHLHYIYIIFIMIRRFILKNGIRSNFLSWGRGGANGRGWITITFGS